MIKAIKILGCVGALALAPNVFAQTCPASPDAAWDNVREDASNLEIVSPGIEGNCAMSVFATSDDSDRARVQDQSPVDEASIRVRYMVDFSNLSNVQTTERLKIHNQQCTGGTGAGCPSIGVVQHKLRGDGSGGLQIRGFFGDTTGNGNRERWDIFPVAGVNVIETQVVIGDGSCNGIGRVWINNDVEGSPDVEFTDLCNGGWTGGIDQANYGIIKANATYSAGQANQAIIFDSVEERRQTFIGCGSVSC